jgi:hypothetical protein
MRYSAPGFTHIRPVWVGDLGTIGQKSTFGGLGLKIVILYFLLKNFKTVAHNAKTGFFKCCF